MKAMKDEDREAIAKQFGYSVEIITGGLNVSHSLDSAMPHFHRYNGTCTTLARFARDERITIPSVHATRFAIPCGECYPEKL